MAKGLLPYSILGTAALTAAAVATRALGEASEPPLVAKARVLVQLAQDWLARAESERDLRQFHLTSALATLRAAQELLGDDELQRATGHDVARLVRRIERQRQSGTPTAPRGPRPPRPKIAPRG